MISLRQRYFNISTNFIESYIHKIKNGICNSFLITNKENQVFLANNSDTLFENPNTIFGNGQVGKMFKNVFFNYDSVVVGV